LPSAHKQHTQNKSGGSSQFSRAAAPLHVYDAAVINRLLTCPGVSILNFLIRTGVT
jgi:hypothetical protein